MEYMTYLLFAVLLFIAVTLNSFYKLFERYTGAINEVRTKRELKILEELQQIRRELEKQKQDN